MLQWRRQYGVVHKFTAPCSVVLPEAPLLTGKRVHSMNELLAAMRLSIRIFAKPFTVHKKNIFAVISVHYNYRPTAGDRVPAIGASPADSSFHLFLLL